MYAEKLTEEQIREIMNLISDDGSVRIVQIRTYNSSFEDCVNWSKVPEVPVPNIFTGKRCMNTLATNMPLTFCWNIKE